MNYIISFPDENEIYEGISDLVILDFVSITKFNSLNIKKEYNLKTLPVIAILDDMLAKNFDLHAGIDDFIYENVTEQELILRIKFLMCRLYGINTEETIQIKDLMIDVAQHKALISFEPIDLTYMEFKLLLFFASNKNRAFTRNHILERVWSYDYYGGTRTVDVHVRRLRSKLGKYGQYIETVRNVGYKFSD
ncbi:MAG: winged helix-turn-helix domain-containing protein [Vampirovibrionia bacterium]